MKKKTCFWIFWALLFVGAFLILSRVGYSDGDDAYFYQYTHSMGFFEYLSWRYQTWVGRMSGEALVYLAFRGGLWFWRGVNALMLVLMPIGILKLAHKVMRGIGAGYQRQSLQADGRERGYGIEAAIFVVSGYLLMEAMTFGYAAVWVNGSIFYTWTFTCGIYALFPIADLVFLEREDIGKERSGTSIFFDLDGVDWRMFLFSIPCCVAASMSIEQMGAVLLVFEVLGIVCCAYRKRAVHILMFIQMLVTLAAFLILFFAPGNDIRVAAEVVTWMPEYETMSFGQHLFITVQWLLSSFANENRMFLCGIWIVGVFLIIEKKKREKRDYVCIGGAGILTAAAFLPFAGITALSDMGMGITDITVRIDAVPSLKQLSGNQMLALLWWGAALVFTFLFLWRISGRQITLLLVYLAGIASEAILFFSPTMYASGARVYYLTNILYLFLILCLSMKLSGKCRQRIFYGVMVFLGIGNFLFQMPVFLRML